MGWVVLAPALFGTTLGICVSIGNEFGIIPGIGASVNISISFSISFHYFSTFSDDDEEVETATTLLRPSVSVHPSFVRLSRGTPVCDILYCIQAHAIRSDSVYSENFLCSTALNNCI